MYSESAWTRLYRRRRAGPTNRRAAPTNRVASATSTHVRAHHYQLASNRQRWRFSAPAPASRCRATQGCRISFVPPSEPWIHVAYIYNAPGLLRVPPCTLACRQVRKHRREDGGGRGNRRCCRRRRRCYKILECTVVSLRFSVFEARARRVGMSIRLDKNYASLHRLRNVGGEAPRSRRAY